MSKFQMFDSVTLNKDIQELKFGKIDYHLLSSITIY